MPTDDRDLWFKTSIRPLAYEIPLLELLGRRRPECVPQLLAAERERAWMLMTGAGVRLHDLHPDRVPLVIWAEFLRTYARLQLDVAPAVDALVAAAVPDRRLPTLVEGFLRVPDNPRLVGSAPSGGLDEVELTRLRAVVPTLLEAVDVVGALGLPDSVQHDDLHVWNVCVDDGGYRFIDWGDACIAQPLLTLSVPLAEIGGDGAADARAAYLEPWTALRPLEEQHAVCDSAVLLAQVTGVLKWELITSGLSDGERGGYADVIPKRLRQLLELACA